MKKILIISLIFILPIADLKAQDQLYKRDNSKLLVKITEVNPTLIKYKLHSNPTGPEYSEPRNNVILIIYATGLHEIIDPPSEDALRTSDAKSPEQFSEPARMSKKDSLTYYQNSNSISLNFLNFFNNEVGLIYQKDFFASNFNIIIPFSIGVEKPGITQSVYFGNNNYSGNNYSTSRFDLQRKLYEIGFGIHYYPSLRTNVNYFVGPVFRFIQYDGQHIYIRNYGNPGSYVNINKNATLTRYCMSITNGVIIRTRSRLTTSLFGSLGFKSDAVDNEVQDPVTGAKVKSIRSPLSLYFWTGFNVGFSF